MCMILKFREKIYQHYYNEYQCIYGETTNVHLYNFCQGLTFFYNVSFYHVQERQGQEI